MNPITEMFSLKRDDPTVFKIEEHFPAEVHLIRNTTGADEAARLVQSVLIGNILDQLDSKPELTANERASFGEFLNGQLRNAFREARPGGMISEPKWK